MTDSQVPDPEIVSARHEVELARAELEVRLRDVGRVGSRMWARAGRRARPILIGGAVVVGALLNVVALRRAAQRTQDLSTRIGAEQGAAAGMAANGIRTIESLKASGLEDSFFTRWSGLHAKAVTFVIRRMDGVHRGWVRDEQAAARTGK